jgi:hypothetical protein
MTEEKLNISLEILLLNDLFHSNSIDKDIYDKATQKILETEKIKQVA